MSRDLSTYSPEFKKFMAEWCWILQAQGPQQDTTCKGAAVPMVLHVTQGSAPESDRHPAAALTLDRPQERNGCVAQMEMPHRNVARPADESRASAVKIEFPQHPAEAAEREESVSTVEGHGMRASACETMQPGTQDVRSGRSAYQSAPADSSQNFSSELFTALVSAAGGIL